jgi:hypothetical protein
MLTAIAMGAGLAHLFELPNKIDIGAADYLTVQRNYRFCTKEEDRSPRH